MIYLSSSCNQGKNLNDFFKQSTARGIKNFELSGGGEYQQNYSNCLMEYKKKYDLEFTIHNYFPPPKEPFILNIASDDQTLRKKSINFVKQSIDLAAMIGSALYTVHSGYLVDLKISNCGQHFIPSAGKMINRKAAWNNLKLSVTELCQYSAERNILFGIENLFPYKQDMNYSLMCNSSDLLEALEEFRTFKNFGILLDLGHAQISSNLLGFNLETFLEDLTASHKDRILEVHISDNNGISDTHMLPEKDSWMTRFVIDSNFKNIPIAIEARNDRLDKTIAYYLFLNNKLGFCDD